MTARLAWLAAAALLLAAPGCRCNKDRADDAPASPGHPERSGPTPVHPERSGAAAESKGPPVFALHLIEHTTPRGAPAATRVEIRIRDGELRYTKSPADGPPLERSAHLSPGDLAAIERSVRAANLLDAEPLPASPAPDGPATLWSAELSVTLDHRENRLTAGGPIWTEQGGRTDLVDAPLYRSLRSLTATLESLARKRSQPPSSP